MPQSKAQIKATNNYIRKNYDRINLTVEAGDKEAWKKAMQEHGMDSLNDFIRYCVEKEIGGDSDD